MNQSNTAGSELAAIRALEVDLGLKIGFFEALITEDDWSFVIKLHALVEAAVTHLLAHACGNASLVAPFAYLELSNARAGKMAFAEALQCLDQEDRRFIRSLSEIRNKFVHDVRHVGLTLDEYITGLDANQFATLRRAIGPGTDPFVIEGRKVPEAQFVRENVKTCIWLMAMFTLALAYDRKRLPSTRHKLYSEVLDAVSQKALRERRLTSACSRLKLPQKSGHRVRSN